MPAEAASSAAPEDILLVVNSRVTRGEKRLKNEISKDINVVARERLGSRKRQSADEFSDDMGSE